MRSGLQTAVRVSLFVIALAGTQGEAQPASSSSHQARGLRRGLVEAAQGATGGGGQSPAPAQQPKGLVALRVIG